RPPRGATGRRPGGPGARRGRRGAGARRDLRTGVVMDHPMTPGAAELVQRFRTDGRFVLRRSWQVGVVTLLVVGFVLWLLVDLARSGAPMPGYVGLVVFSPALVIALVFAVRQLLPGGAVVVDRLGVHFGDHHVAWAQVQDLA